MKKVFYLVLAIGISQLSQGQKKQKSLTFQNEVQKTSYVIGLDIAQNLKKSNIDIDETYFIQAFKDLKSGDKLLFPSDSIMPYMQKFMAKKMEQKKAEATATSKAFLDKNKANPNVKVTTSGLQYEVITPGDGTNFPKATDNVKVKYLGKKIDGTEFDGTDKNNKGEALELPLNNVILGWTEGVQLMSKGAKYKFYIPSELAYGENGAGPIGPNETLIFDIELVDFSTPKVETPAPTEVKSTTPASTETKETKKESHKGHKH